MADRAVQLINSLTHTGDFAGQPFELRPWQEDVVRRIFETDDAGRRIYREVFLALPRKQGKTELAAAILLVFLAGMGREEQQIYSASGTRDQAAQIFRAAASMVRRHPVLSKKCLVYDGYKRIVCEPLGNVYEALSSDADKGHSLGPSVLLLDELHIFRGRDFYDSLVTGMGARQDPLTLNITTAGYDRTSVCYEIWKHAQQVKEGVRTDPSFLPILYAADPDDDWSSEDVWRKAMPALGDFCKLEFLRAEFRKARRLPGYENTFRRLYLNQWTEQATRWIPADRWAACGDPVDVESLRGLPCYVGLDLGVVGDMSAFVALFPNELGGFDAVCKFWVPEHGRWRDEERNRDLYLTWHRQGFLEFTEGESQDHNQIEDAIVAFNEDHPIRVLAADRAYARMLLSRLYNLHDIPVRELAQGPITLNEPMTRIEQLVLEKTLRHGGHPVLAWNVANADVARNRTGLMYLDKSQKTQRIDGLAAMVDAMAGTLGTDEAGEPSVYESRGLISL